MAGPSRAMLIAAVVALAGALPVAHAADPPWLMPPTARVAGQTQADLSRAWWQWAMSFDEDDSPVADPSGQRCHLRQSGPVWFLAGTYGSRRTERRCTVPAGKYLFFPLVNHVSYVSPDSEERSCAELRREVRLLTNRPDALLLDIDGVRAPDLRRHRQAPARCFDLSARAREPETLTPAASDGYWVLVRPLPPGRHALNFGGILPTLSQAVTYTLQVE